MLKLEYVSARGDKMPLTENPLFYLTHVDGQTAAGLHVDLSEPVLSVSMLDPAASGYAQCEMYAKNLRSVFYQQQNSQESRSYWELSCKLVEY